MTGYRIWPRMSRATAEERFAELTLDSGPMIDVSLTNFDFDGVGERINQDDLLALRDSITEIASKYGFKARHGYQQETFPNRESAIALDREYASAFRRLTPMRWAEAGSREVWSWFALALLPDVTHWRWRSAVAIKSGEREGEWYKARWIGFDLTRHSWSRYWWRSVQFESDPELLNLLREHDLNHLQERADTLGANPTLMATFGRQLLDLHGALPSELEVSQRSIFEDSARRMLRRLAYVDDAALSEDETVALVRGFMRETTERLGVTEV